MANTLKFGNGQWATGNGTALAYNDENANFKPLPFDFTRASSGTTVNQSGLIETVGSGIPRIDFLGNTKGALLLEPARSNYITYSKDFSSWTQADTSTVSIADSFDGSNNAYKVSVASAGGFQTIRNTGLSVSGVQTFTIYAKKDTLNFTRILFGGFGNFWVDLQNGTQGTTTGTFDNITITSAGNGFFKIVATFTPTSAVTEVFLYPSIGNGNVSQTSGSVIFQYAQLEAGSYATSYIPTSGSAVTRVADSCSQTPPDGVIGLTEGVMYFETNSLLPSGTRSIALAYTSGSSYYQIYFTSSNQIRVDVNGVLLVISSSINLNILNKIAFAYKSGDNALYINGVLVASSGNATVPSSLNDFYLGNSLGNEQSGSYQDFKLYNTRLSNSELAALTTI